MRFAEGNAYDSARSAGVTLKFGIVGNGVTPSHTPTELVCMDSWEDGLLCRETVAVAADEWDAAHRATAAVGHRQPPPYLFFSTFDADGFVRHLRLFAVYCDGGTIAVTESKGEAGFADHLVQCGCVFVKPVLRADMGSILGRLGLCSSPMDLYRPDFLVFRRRGPDWQLFVVELRGFKEGRFPWYDEDLCRKREYFEVLDPHLRFKERNAWEYRMSDIAARSITWRGISSDWRGESRAAAAWRQGLASTPRRRFVLENSR